MSSVYSLPFSPTRSVATNYTEGKISMIHKGGLIFELLETNKTASFPLTIANYVIALQLLLKTIQRLLLPELYSMKRLRMGMNPTQTLSKR